MTATLQMQQPHEPAGAGERPPKVRRKESASKSIFDRAIMRRASLDAFRKLKGGHTWNLGTINLGLATFGFMPQGPRPLTM